MYHTLAVRLGPHTADWNHLPEEVVMIINNFIRKMDYDDRWGWGESINIVLQSPMWSCHLLNELRRTVAGHVDKTKAILIYNYQLFAFGSGFPRVQPSKYRKQMLASIGPPRD